MKKSILMSALIGTAILNALPLELTAGQCGGKMKKPDDPQPFASVISAPEENPNLGNGTTVKARSSETLTEATEECNSTSHSSSQSPQALDELTKMAEGLSSFDMENPRYTKIVDPSNTQTPLHHVPQTKTRGVFTGTPKVSRKPALSTPTEENAEEINLDVVPTTKPLAVPKRVQRPGRSNLTRAKSVDENQNNVPVQTQGETVNTTNLSAITTISDQSKKPFGGVGHNRDVLNAPQKQFANKNKN